MYRTSARRGEPDAMVVCRACGVRSEVAFASDTTFGCRGCRLEQPVLRGAGDMRLESATLADYQATGSYGELAPLLESFGTSGKAFQIRIACDGIQVVASLSLNSGVVQGLDLLAPAPGLPEMTLVRETAAHADAKARGIVREVQTGDGAFDEGVYVESPVRDEDVRMALAAPAVRLAVRKLLDVTERVRVDDGQVSVFVAKDRGAFDPHAIREQLGWMRVLAGAPRPRVVEYAPVSGIASVAKAATYALAPLGIGAVALASSAWGTVNYEPYLVGGAVGLVLAFVVHPLFRFALRGRSTSHKDLLAARVTSVLFLPCLATGALLFANGAFDRSPERSVTLTVVSSSFDDDDGSKIHVQAADDAGKTHSFTFTAPRPTTRAYVTAQWRAGALGWTWQSGHAVLTSTRPEP